METLTHISPRALNLAVLETAQKVSPEAKVILFGSRARDDARPDSDWDFLVLISENNLASEQEIINKVFQEVELLYGKGISLVVHSFEEWNRRQQTPFYQEVQRDGIEIMSYSKEDLIHYRLARAEEVLHDAEILINSKSWNSASNRLYYACYHAVLALLSQLDFSLKSHSGVKTLFNREFSVSASVSTEQLTLYNQLFTYRHHSDYEDMIDMSEELVISLLPKVQHFVNTIKMMIENHQDQI